LEDAGLHASVQKLQALAALMPRLEQALPFALVLFNEDTVRQMCMVRTNFYQQWNPASNMVNGYISIQPQDIEQLFNIGRKLIGMVYGRMQSMNPGQASQAGQPNQSGQPNQPGNKLGEQARSQQQGGPQVQLPQSTQNLQQPVLDNMIKTTSKQDNKGPGSGSKAPAAPTSSKPPFSIGATLSPHGVPTYDGISTNLTPDKLQIPPQKRRKTGQTSTVSTPANQGTTPVAMTSPQLKMSPDTKRQTNTKTEAPQPREPEKSFKCPDEYCNYSVRGFEQEEDLKSHMQDQHNEVGDPLDFFLHSAADAFDVDMDGNAKVSKLDAEVANKRQTTSAAAVAARSQHLGAVTIKKEGIKSEGQTPAQSKQGIATPSPGFIKHTASPAATLTPSGFKKPQQGQATTSAPKTTMMETMAEKAGFALPKTTETLKSGKLGFASPVAGEDATGRDQSLAFMDSIRESLDGVESRVLGEEFMDWNAGPSPIMTPTSSDSSASIGSSSLGSLDNVSEHDRLRIALEWDPWAMGSGIQFNLVDEYGMGELGMQSAFDATKGSSQAQDGVNITNGDGMNDANMAAQPGLDWDSMFGAGAGLDKDASNWNLDAYGNNLFANATFFEVS